MQPSYLGESDKLPGKKLWNKEKTKENKEKGKEKKRDKINKYKMKTNQKLNSIHWSGIFSPVHNLQVLIIC